MIYRIESRGQDYLLEAIRLLEQYAQYIPSVGQNFRENEWYGFRDDQISYEGRSVLKEDLTALAEGYKALQDTSEQVNEKYGTGEMNYAMTRRWQSKLAFLADSDVVTPSLLSEKACRYARPYLAAMKETGGTIVSIRDGLLKTYTPEILKELEGRDLYTKLTGQYSSFFSRMFSGEYKNLAAGIQLYRRDVEKLKYPQLLELADQLTRLQSAEKTYRENEAAVPGCLGACYQGPDTDWSHVTEDLDRLEGYFKDGPSPFGAISGMSPETFAGSQDAFRTDSGRMYAQMAAVDEAKNRISGQFSQDLLNLEDQPYEDCIRKLEGCLGEFDSLGNWISFMNLLDQLKQAGLSEYIDVIIDKNIDPGLITGIYRKLFYRQWVENIIFSVPELASFSRIKQDQAVGNFVEKDNLQYEISKIQIQSELSQLRPNLDMVAGGSAVAILRREGNKKRKQMPIRRLLSETAGLVQIIKPCFMMSPLSVSTFLDPEKLHFDTVVFDEASQIFPQDAVGAIYRGKQLIVVGDSRQMPPSNFFNASLNMDDDDEEIGDINDFESILDVCSSVFTTKGLSWHYRSHYEQLIAFSNRNFYNNNLVTFPSSARDHEGIGVDYYYVDGTFDRRSKTNKAEAEFVVDLIYRNIGEHPDRSLGVVAFSIAQQNLIDRMLVRRREADPSYEWFFRADNPEPFFIKNLETVQGDERDTIIFSVAYARDSQGRFIQNFGPLNREGGERRLNVAVTRAKDNVQLVASIRYTDINLNSTESKGVRLLRAYLEYAQNGEQALESAAPVPGQDRYDFDLEMEVCDFLRDQGFTV
ncbi:MAG: DNA2/NAM7 family helicase, partial [Eubacterium sp.]|nr:DNA2/NAM7 family helicase [Eubacterium sp.]